jgi:hypothetical protein
MFKFSYDGLLPILDFAQNFSNSTSYPYNPTMKSLGKCEILLNDHFKALCLYRIKAAISRAAA